MICTRTLFYASERSINSLPNTANLITHHTSHITISRRARSVSPVTFAARSQRGRGSAAAWREKRGNALCRRRPSRRRAKHGHIKGVAGRPLASTKDGPRCGEEHGFVPSRSHSVVLVPPSLGGHDEGNGQRATSNLHLLVNLRGKKLRRLTKEA